MAVYRVKNKTGVGFYFLVKRSIAGEIHQFVFPGTLGGEKKALRKDAQLQKIQKESRAKNSTYTQSKYGFLRGLNITYTVYDGKFIPVMTYFLKVNGLCYHKAIDVRCGRTFKACFDVMVEEVEKILGVTKYTKATKFHKDLKIRTYKFFRERTAYNREVVMSRR